MLTREHLVQRVKTALQVRNIEYLDFSTINTIVFDFIVKLEKPLVIKILKDIECFKKEISKNLKSVAQSISGKPLIIAEYDKQRKIPDNSVGIRYGVAFLNTNTFEKLLDNEYPYIYYSRGGAYVSIIVKDKEKLKNKLKEIGISRRRIHEIIKDKKAKITFQLYKYLHNLDIITIESINPIEISMSNDIDTQLIERINNLEIVKVEKSPHDISIFEKNSLILLAKYKKELIKEFEELKDFLEVEGVIINNLDEIKELVKKLKNSL